MRLLPSARRSAAGCLLLVAASAAHATDYRTTFDVSPNPWSWTGLEFLWSSSALSGSAAQLDAWTITAFIGTTPDYQDVVVDAGVVQAIGGAPRSEIIFTFDTTQPSSQILGSWDNDYAVDQSGVATGLTFNLYSVGAWGSSGGSLYAIPYVDGAGAGEGPTYTISALQTQVVVTVPEPTAVGALALVGGLLPLALRRRRRLLAAQAIGA